LLNVFCAHPITAAPGGWFGDRPHFQLSSTAILDHEDNPSAGVFSIETSTAFLPSNKAWFPQDASLSGSFKACGYAVSNAY
jgi:hypothetical protein